MANIEHLKGKIIPAFSREMLSSMSVPEGELNVFLNYKLFPREILVKAGWNYKEESEHTS